MDMFAGYVSPSTMAAAGRLISFEFEVFGKVQGNFEVTVVGRDIKPPPLVA